MPTDIFCFLGDLAKIHTENLHNAVSCPNKSELGNLRGTNNFKGKLTTLEGVASQLERRHHTRRSYALRRKSLGNQNASYRFLAKREGSHVAQNLANGASANFASLQLYHDRSAASIFGCDVDSAWVRSATVFNLSLLATVGDFQTGFKAPDLVAERAM